MVAALALAAVAGPGAPCSQLFLFLRCVRVRGRVGVAVRADNAEVKKKKERRVPYTGDVLTDCTHATLYCVTHCKTCELPQCLELNEGQSHVVSSF